MKSEQLARRSGVVSAMLLCSSLCPNAFAKQGDKLNGDWEIAVTADQGASREVKDVLHFKQTAVSSDYFVKLGYTPATYDTVEPKFGPVQFKATSKNDQGATIDWQGTALADSIEGTVTVTTKAGEKTTYSFNGTRKE